MISESFLPPELYSRHAHPWALSVFRVENPQAQQRVLQALRRLGRADLTVLGTQRGNEAFVVIDWDATLAEARPVVMAADRHAAITFTSARLAARP